MTDAASAGAHQAAAATESSGGQQQAGSRKRRGKAPLDEAVRQWLVGMSLADCCDAFAQVHMLVSQMIMTLCQCATGSCLSCQCQVPDAKRLFFFLACRCVQ